MIDNNIFCKCADCGHEYKLYELDGYDYCLNCENLWLDGKSLRYGNFIGKNKICKTCHKNKDLINFRCIIHTNKTYYQNECRSCQLTKRRDKNQYKSHKRPHLYLTYDNLVVLKVNNDFIFFDASDLDKIKPYCWIIWQRTRKHPKYVKMFNKDKTIMLHQQIIGDIPFELEIDHKNHNGLDNRKENLRLANSSQNAANAGLRKNNTSGYKGVFLRKDCKNEKWTARIWKDNKCIWLGTFSSSKEAATAYNKAAIELFGEFACLNEIQDRQPIEI